MGLIDGVYQYQEGESVGPTFSGLLNRLGDSVRTKFNAAPTLYTPALTNLTIGNGTVEAAYRPLAKNLMWITFRLVIGSTTAGSGQIGFGFPPGIATAGYTYEQTLTGNVYAGGANFLGTAHSANGQGAMFLAAPAGASSANLANLDRARLGVGGEVDFTGVIAVNGL